ncbi:MAG: hypothetical protein FWE42_00405 [Defluviitaleaceae bacterium]|nr:hypothetical protein [Defluviitaleaceae bacterium]
MKLKTILTLTTASLTALTLYQLNRSRKIPTLPANTPRPYKIHIHDFLGALAEDKPFDTTQLADTFQFIHQRYDCSDFLANTIIRILYAYSHKLDTYQPGLKSQMEDLLLNFKYHWDQPGQDSLCTWSENHQILFAGLEYLAGHLYKGKTFINSGRPGTYHKARGKKRILAWCKRRFRYGFTEWYSNNYYLEDLVAMSNIQEFAPDKEVRNAMTQILHIIYYDIATQSLNGSFVSTGGRMYENNKKSARGGCALNRIIASLFEIDLDQTTDVFYEELTAMTNNMDLNVLLNKTYQVPGVIKKIAKDTTPQVIKASNSIDITEGVKAGIFGPKDEQLAAQWEMEAFTNHQIFRHTMKGIARNNMFASEFFAPLKMLNLTVLKPFYGLLAKIINPITNGKATQRANTYTYRTPHYLMATTQGYQPGGFSDQQHIWNCLINHDICVFATNPSGELNKTGALSKSPGYWVGNSRNPHAAQHLNRILAIYPLPNKKAPFEKGLYDYTHAYFPYGKFDEAYIGRRYAVGRAGDSYVALIGSGPLVQLGQDELAQCGRKQYWVCECSSAEAESFGVFMARIGKLVKEITFDGDTLQYSNLKLTFGGDFYVDGAKQNTQYKRYDSVYCVGERGGDGFVYGFGGEAYCIEM